MYPARHGQTRPSTFGYFKFANTPKLVHQPKLPLAT